MSCAKNTNIQVNDADLNNFILENFIKKETCRKKGFYPIFTSNINNLSLTNSIAGIYTIVYINGSNFFPACYGPKCTYVNFGSYTKLPITFYNSNNISFAVPLNAVSGIYNVQVVTIYNESFSSPLNQSYPGIQNYSNSIIYTIT
jgi:hypothetical protein